MNNPVSTGHPGGPLSRAPLKDLFFGRFSRFAAIGATCMLLATITNGLLIDLLGLSANLVAPLIVILFFLLKYVAYVALDVIKPRFLRFVATNILLTAFAAWLIPFTINHSPLNATVSTALILGALVLIRFSVFRMVRLIAT